MLANLIAITLVSILIAGPSDTPIGEQLTIEGEIYFPKNGHIMLEVLKDPDATDSNNDPSHRQTIKLTATHLKSKKVPFKITNLAPGTYAIQVFQDVNSNYELDFGRLGPKEPWGNYKGARPLLRAPTFDEMAFELKRNLEGIVIRLK